MGLLELEASVGAPFDGMLSARKRGRKPREARRQRSVKRTRTRAMKRRYTKRKTRKTESRKMAASRQMAGRHEEEKEGNTGRARAPL
jgi:hypothetical protein